MSKFKGKPKKESRKDSNIEDVVETEIEFTCPVRGRVKQKVKVKRLKKSATNMPNIVSTKDDLNGIDDDGLSIYEGSGDEENPE